MLNENKDEVPVSSPVSEILYLPKGITTKEALKRLHSRNFKCCYQYRFIDNQGEERIRAIFINHKNDEVVACFTKSEFYPQKAKARLYATRKIVSNCGEVKIKSYAPIDLQNEVPHNKGQFLADYQPLEAVTNLNWYGGNMWVIPEHPEIEDYRRNHLTNDHNYNDLLNSAIRLCHIYKFGETYKLMKPNAKPIYALLSEKNIDLFYRNVADILTYSQGKAVIDLALDILKIDLDKNRLAIFVRNAEIPPKSALAKKTPFHKLKISFKTGAQHFVRSHFFSRMKDFLGKKEKSKQLIQKTYKPRF